jgi:hypothetical protein
VLGREILSRLRNANTFAGLSCVATAFCGVFWHEGPVLSTRDRSPLIPRLDTLEFVSVTCNSYSKTVFYLCDCSKRSEEEVVSDSTVISWVDEPEEGRDPARIISHESNDL